MRQSQQGSCDNRSNTGKQKSDPRQCNDPTQCCNIVSPHHSYCNNTKLTTLQAHTSPPRRKNMLIQKIILQEDNTTRTVKWTSEASAGKRKKNLLEQLTVAFHAHSPKLKQSPTEALVHTVVHSISLKLRSDHHICNPSIELHNQPSPLPEPLFSYTINYLSSLHLSPAIISS